MKSSDPLAPLERKRSVELDVARRQLADARAHVDRSRARIEQTEQRLAEHHAETAAELRRPTPDASLVGEELTRLAGYERRRSREARRLGSGIVEAREAADRAERALADAQRNVARAQASQEGVARRRARWEAEAARRASERADEAAAEALAAACRAAGPPGTDGG